MVIKLFGYMSTNIVVHSGTANPIYIYACLKKVFQTGILTIDDPKLKTVPTSISHNG